MSNEDLDASTDITADPLVPTDKTSPAHSAAPCAVVSPAAAMALRSAAICTARDTNGKWNVRMWLHVQC